MTRFFSEELSWWSDLDDRLFGAVTLDRIDNDYSWVILGRDEVNQFRAIDFETSLRSERVAEARLRLAIARWSRDPEFAGYVAQGENSGVPLDLFEVRPGVSDSDLHPYFIQLRDSGARYPAREVFSAISPWMKSSDRQLVKEFQESQFDQRLWEIYLWATFRDQGYDVAHTEAPDLIVTSPIYSFSVEATTVSPSESGVLANHPNPTTPEEYREFLKDYMPMKFGSPLVSKLNKTDASGKHYWERNGADNLPFLIAIADFHKPADGITPGSMTYSQSALYVYLYGTRVTVDFDEDGKLLLSNEAVAGHTYGTKVIPSGFFDLPKSENVSAVLFSNAGTIAKFDRMGVQAGFILPDYTYLRIGHTFDPHPNALVGIPFAKNIQDPDYAEFWGDELQVFHNPLAINKLPVEAIPDAAHFFYEDGKLSTIDHGGRVLGSITQVLHAVSDEEFEARKKTKPH